MDKRISLIEEQIFAAQRDLRRLRDVHAKKMLSLPIEQRTKCDDADLAKYIHKLTSLLYYYRMKNIKSDLSSNC